MELDVNSHQVIDSTEALFPNQTFEFNNKQIVDDYGVKFTNLKSGILKSS